MEISIVIPTFNPDPSRFEATLRAIRNQTMPSDRWECVVVDNASQLPVDADWCSKIAGRELFIVKEPVPGLSHARLTGLKAANADLVVFCDDDNLLDFEYLENSTRLMTTNPRVGVAGGRSIAKYIDEVPEWYSEGLAPLGCRDLGDLPLFSSQSEFSINPRYPHFAPIGAGMVVRKVAMRRWAETVGISGISDRKGSSLSSAGDCDMVLHALADGYDAAYWPDLVLQHIIPPTRLTREYLGAISRAAFRDFIRVLDLHHIRTWEPIHPGTVPFRVLKAWFKHKPWHGPAEWIRWQSSMGQFEGRAKLSASE